MSPAVARWIRTLCEVERTPHEWKESEATNGTINSYV